MSCVNPLSGRPCHIVGETPGIEPRIMVTSLAVEAALAPRRAVDIGGKAVAPYVGAKGFQYLEE